MSPRRWIALVVAVILLLTGLGQLQGARGAVEIRGDQVGATPVSVYRLAGSLPPAPAVVIAHGFAGSRQLMEAYALTLAQAGYVVVSFDFLGHGRHPDPMRGDLTSVEGTTQLLMDQTAEVIDYARTVPGADGRIALLGHSMATDVLVRQALRERQVMPLVMLSMFSGAVTPEAPKRLLAISGAWEGWLRAEAVKMLRQVDPTAEEGETVQAGDVLRRAVVAPGVEHVGILYSGTGMREARAWLNAAFDRTATGPVAQTGGWILLTLAGLVLLAWPLSGFLPAGKPPRSLAPGEFWLAALVPPVVAPLIATSVKTTILPVLVADYLTLHLLIYGALTLISLRGLGYRVGRYDGAALAFLVIYGIAVFGGFLDTYVASFMPAGPRPLIIMAIALGAVPYMLGEARLLEAGNAPLGRRLAARGLFLGSLGLAVALDFERLMFLLFIVPVILLFFAIFGSMGGWAGRRTGSAGATGVALGLILAWALGVTFPMFASV